MWFKDVELESENIKLVPLTLEHADALVNAANDGELWKLWFTSVPSDKTINDYISVYAVLLADFLKKTVGFRVKTTSIKGKYTDVFLDFCGHVDEDYILGAAERDCDVVEIL